MKEQISKSRLPQVALIGAYPPPIGGNSLHIYRLFHLLKKHGYKVQVLDYIGQDLLNDSPNIKRLSGNLLSKAWQAFYFMRGFQKGSIMHFHVSTLIRFQRVAPFLLLSSIGHKRVITIHSGRFVENWQTPLRRASLRILLSWFQGLIVVSQEIKTALVSMDIDPSQVFVIPAYLKEIVQSEHLPDSFKEIPQGKIKIITSGQIIRIYNYEILIDSISHIDPGKFHIIFAFYGEHDAQYETTIKKLISQYSNVTIYQDLSPQAFLAVLDSSDIYVRTTQRDGDSVAVREALELGKKVYATDCVQRPSGCELFTKSEELILQLQNYDDEKQIKTNPSGDGFPQILELYGFLHGGINNVTSSR